MLEFIIALLGLTSMIFIPIFLIIAIISIIRKKSSKKWFVAMGITTLIFILCLIVFPKCEHEWSQATCTEPKTCIHCGETEGEALGHHTEWSDWEYDVENAIYSKEYVCNYCEQILDTEESKKGVVDNIHATADFPDKLMNSKLKSIIDLFSKGFSQSGLNVADATTYDDGENYIFYFDGLEFLGEEPEGDYFRPRICYSKDAINNDGIPDMIYFAFSYPRKSNGYEETVEMVEDIAKALGISDSGLIDNDYSSSSKWATGEYATFMFPHLNIKLTVSNMQSSVEIEIVPIS